jgi:hypothetical protein
MGAYLSLSLVDMLHAIGEGFDLSGLLSSLWLTSFRLFACLDFGTGPFFLTLLFLGAVFLLMVAGFLHFETC